MFTQMSRLAASTVALLIRLILAFWHCIYSLLEKPSRRTYSTRVQYCYPALRENPALICPLSTRKAPSTLMSM
ncbi:hypothetical protein B0J13DRAFT_567874, partial [Dactylonectria estremocensis]